MNRLKLSLHSKSQISFNMNIFGTQSVPSQVALNLENGNKVLSFLAKRQNDEYVCDIEHLNATFTDQTEIKCSITVILGGKVFTPYKGVVELVDVAPQPKEEMAAQQTDDAEANQNEIEHPTPVHAMVPPNPISIIAPQVKTEDHNIQSPASKISLLKDIEKPIIRQVKKEPEVKESRRAQSKENGIFEIKRISVIFR